MSTPNPASAASSGVADRIDRLCRQLSQQEAALNRSTRLTGIIGLIALVLLSGYFYYGYLMIADLLEPKMLVPYAAGMLNERLPDARKAIVIQINDAAPGWAAQISKNFQKAIPTGRGKLEVYVMEQTDELLGKATSLTEDRFRTTLRENRELLDKGFKELADSETLSDETLQALVEALEQQLKSDMKEQAETVLETLRLLSSRVKRLQVGTNLDSEEKHQRRVLMIARRLQLMEADPRPINVPKLNSSNPETTATSDEQSKGDADSKGDKQKEDKSDANDGGKDSKPANAESITDKAETKVEKPASEKASDKPTNGTKSEADAKKAD